MLVVNLRATGIMPGQRSSSTAMNRGTGRTVGSDCGGKEATIPIDNSVGGAKATSTRVLTGATLTRGDYNRREKWDWRKGDQQGSERRQYERGMTSAKPPRRYPAKPEAAVKIEKGSRKERNKRELWRNLPQSLPRRECTVFDCLIMSKSKFDAIPDEKTNGRMISSGAPGASLALETASTSKIIRPPTGGGRGKDLKGGNALGRNNWIPTQKYIRGRTGSNEAVRKLGKQRLGPKKRKLSSLKKRILLHRAAQWGYGVPLPGDRSSSSFTATNFFSTAHIGHLWVVNIRNLIDEEDVEDEEEQKEIERDLRQMASEFGSVVRAEVPRTVVLSGTPAVEAALVKVIFSTAEEAERARAGFHGRVVAGNTLEANVTDLYIERVDDVDAGVCGKGDACIMGTVDEMKEFDDCATVRDTRANISATGVKGGMEAASAASDSAAAQCPNLAIVEDSSDDNVGEPGDTNVGDSPDHQWVVAVRNLIDADDDLDDDEEYAEVYADATEIVGAYSSPISVNIIAHNSAGEYGEVGTVIATFASRKEAEQCIEGICGRRIGGQELVAELVGTSANPYSPSDTREHRLAEKLALGPADDDVGASSDADVSTSRKCEGNVGVGYGSSDSSDHVSCVGTISETIAVKCSAQVAQPVAVHEWRVVVKNLIEQEDLEDDDDYAEGLADFASMTSEYGQVLALCIPRSEAEAAGTCSGRAKLGEAVAVFGSLDVARMCATGLGSRTVGGKRLEANVMSPSMDEEQRLGRNFDLSSNRRPSHGVPTVHQPKCESQLDVVQTGHGFVAPPRTGKSAKENGKNGTPSRRYGGEVDSEVAGSVFGTTSHAISAEESAAVTTLGMEASAKNSGSTTLLHVTERGKRIQEKYKEIVALPKHPDSSGWAPKTYPTQRTDPEVDTVVFEMLRRLFQFQERARLADPVKARSRRRVVMGLKEVFRGLRTRKVRLVILAPNVDAMGGESGLDARVIEIIDAAKKEETPIVFALSRRKIGKALGKTIKVSVVGVYSFDGAHEEQKNLARRMEAISKAASDSPTANTKPVATNLGKNVAAESK